MPSSHDICGRAARVTCMICDRAACVTCQQELVQAGVHLLVALHDPGTQKESKQQLILLKQRPAGERGEESM